MVPIVILGVQYLFLISSKRGIDRNYTPVTMLEHHFEHELCLDSSNERHILAVKRPQDATAVQSLVIEY